MRIHKSLDCIVIGYNEIPFEKYENVLAQYGDDSEAYRDLKFSFVNVDGRKLDYTGLLNHVYNVSHSEDRRLRREKGIKSGDLPNLAAVYLTNYLMKRGHRTRYINLFQYEKETLAAYLAENPYCVAITTTFYVVNLPVIEMVEFIRQHNDRVKIVVGGPLIANHARNHGGDELKAAFDDMGADIYVVESAGELTLSRIVECLKHDEPLSRIPNLIYYEGGKMLRNDLSPENNSLDENAIDWPAFSHENLGPTIQTRTARSCAFSCSFCNYPARAGKLTLASLETIEKELDSIQELGGVKNLVFIDDTFNVPLARFKEICRLMIRKNYGLNWFSYFRCSNSDEEAIELMAKSGCKGVFLGIESGSPTILKNMNKAATIEKYAHGVAQLHQHDILTFGSFIIGFPGETAATVNETLAFIKENRPSYYRAQIWYCEPGTPIDQHREKHGINGSGFVWNHATMDSLEAMDHIDKLFLSIDESQWLPQWSFDFWIIPYLLGRGISAQDFGDFMALSNKLLSLEIAAVPADQKRTLQQQYLQSLIEKAKDWNIVS
jgi:radical SAM PhpK family P-methyltransferase